MGGTIGEASHLSLEPEVKGVPLEDDDLLPVLVDLCVKHFGAVKKEAPREKLFGLF